jgi:D-3-phosphoglycerate dehydrogenase
LATTTTTTMTDPKIPVYVLGPFHGDANTRLQSETNLEVVPFSDPRRHEWPGKAVGLLIRRDTVLGETEFARASPRLKVVVKQGIGVDNIDLAAARRHGIAVYNTPAVNSQAVAELSFTLALALGRRVCETDRAVRAGQTLVRANWPAKSLYRKTVGLVGMGNIGTQLAKKWSGAMEAKLVTYDPYYDEQRVEAARTWAALPHTRVDDLDQLLRISDVVTIQVPLSDETRGMIGAREMALMKDQSILVNTARGGIVDERALLEALRRDKFWGVGLDAMEVEPPTLEAYSELLRHQNIIMTPHIGGETYETRAASGVASIETLIAALAGQQPPGRQA